jgi:hypothetical protein
MKRLILTAAIFSFLATSSFAGVVGHIVAGYDDSFSDNSFFDVFNDSDTTMTNVVIYGLQEGSVTWETWNFPDIAPGTDVLQYFFAGGGAFTSDYDDSYFGGGDNLYYLTADGGLISDIFSPNVNNTGNFSAFLGNDSGGAELDIDVADNVANINSPEPGSMALIGTGALLLPILRRRLNRR